MTVSFFIAHLDVMGLLLFSITISALLIVLIEFAYFRQGVRLRHCHRFVGFCRVGVACGNAFRRCAFTRGG